MKSLGVSINTLARDLDVPPNRISEIVNAKRGITADTARRLDKYFSASPRDLARSAVRLRIAGGAARCLAKTRGTSAKSTGDLV